MSIIRATTLAATMLALGGCSPALPPVVYGPPAEARPPAATGPAAGFARITRADAGFRIDYPAAMTVSRQFDRRYLVNDAWKLGAPADAPGQAMLMLTVPGSNKVATGELRIGVSRDRHEVAQCADMPDVGHPRATGKTVINGIGFTTFTTGGAAMGHYLDARSYRTVHEGRCYAIDLLVLRTNPELYDPVRQPPFTVKQAFTMLEKALSGFRFTR